MGYGLWAMVMDFGAWVMGYRLPVKGPASYYLQGSWEKSCSHSIFHRYSIDSFTYKKNTLQIHQCTNVLFLDFHYFAIIPPLHQQAPTSGHVASIHQACHCDKSWLVNHTVCFFLLLRLREHALKRNNQGASSTPWLRLTGVQVSARLSVSIADRKPGA